MKNGNGSNKWNSFWMGFVTALLILLLGFGLLISCDPKKDLPWLYNKEENK